jgi:hypothetical protein
MPCPFIRPDLAWEEGAGEDIGVAGGEDESFSWDISFISLVGEEVKEMRGRGRWFGWGPGWGGLGWGRGNPYPFCRRFPWMPRWWWAYGMNPYTPYYGGVSGGYTPYTPYPQYPVY